MHLSSATFICVTSGRRLSAWMLMQEELAAGEEIARCPSCSLYLLVIYNQDDFQDPSGPEPVVPDPGVPPVTVA